VCTGVPPDTSNTSSRSSGVLTANSVLPDGVRVIGLMCAVSQFTNPDCAHVAETLSHPTRAALHANLLIHDPSLKKPIPVIERSIPQVSSTITRPPACVPEPLTSRHRDRWCGEGLCWARPSLASRTNARAHRVISGWVIADRRGREQGDSL